MHKARPPSLVLAEAKPTINRLHNLPAFLDCQHARGKGRGGRVLQLAEHQKRRDFNCNRKPTTSTSTPTS